MTDVYDEIINMPRHVSPTRRKMSSLERAAQFAPFAALTGYEGILDEEQRQTFKKLELSEDAIYELNVRLNLISENLGRDYFVRIIYFVNDERKDGGRYITYEGMIVRIDDYLKSLFTENGIEIPIGDIYGIQIKGEDYH